MIELETCAAGVVLRVRAQPGARKSELRGQQDGALKVAITQVAEKGKANKALLALLCQALGLKKSQLRIIAGETSSSKRLLVADITARELASRIEDASKV